MLLIWRLRFRKKKASDSRTYRKTDAFTAKIKSKFKRQQTLQSL
jgi:hypothetical protein